MADLSKGVNLNNTLAAQVKPTDEQLLDELYGTASKTTMTDAGVKKYIGPMPKKEPGIVDTAKDIGKGIIRGPFENLKNTAVNLSKYLGIEGTQQELAPFSSDVLEMIGKPSTDAGKIAETISQVGTAVLTTRNIPGATTFTGSMATGAISDFVIWDSNDGRLADLLSEAGVQNELVKYLKHDPKDSAMEDNFKNVVEGALSNVVAEGVIRTTIAGYKAAKASLWASRTPEEVAVAIDGAAVKPIVPKAKKVVTPKVAPDANIVKTPDTKVAKTPGVDFTGMKPPQTAFNYDKMPLSMTTMQDFERRASNKEYEELFQTGVVPLRVIEERGTKLYETIKADNGSFTELARAYNTRTKDLPYVQVALKKYLSEADTKISSLRDITAPTDLANIINYKLIKAEMEEVAGNLNAGITSTARTTTSGRIGIDMGIVRKKFEEASFFEPDKLNKDLENFIDKETALLWHKDLNKFADIEEEVVLKKITDSLDPNDSSIKKILNVLVEERTAGFLSNPVSHFINATGNLLSMPIRTAEYYMAGAVGVFTKSEDRFLLDELNAMHSGVFANTKGTFTAMGNALKAIGDGPKIMEDVFEQGLIDSFKKADTGSYRAISQDYLMGDLTNATAIRQLGGQMLDTIGATIRLPYHALTAVDDMFKRSIYGGQISYIATREANKLGLKGEAKSKFIGEFVAAHQSLFMTPNKELSPELKELIDKHIRKNDGRFHLEAIERAREGTFSEEIRGGVNDSDINRALHFINRARLSFPAAQLIVPFYNTIVNILKFVGRRTPGINMLSQRITSDMAAGGRRRALAQAQMFMGTSLYALGGYLAYNGMVTGAAPKNEREAWKTAGIPEYSIRIGDKWIQYNRFDPIASFLSLTADFTRFHTDMVRRGYADVEGYLDHADEVVYTMTVAFTNNVLNKSMIKGVSDLLKAINDGDATYFESMVASFAPYSGLSNWANQQEYTKEAKGLLEKFIKVYAPYNLRDSLDVLGKPILDEKFFGIKERELTKSPIRKEIMRLQLNVGKFDNKLIANSTQIELEPEDHWKMQQLLESKFKLENKLNALVATPEYKQAPDGIDFSVEGTKKWRIKKMITDGREQARQAFVRSNPAVMKQYTDKVKDNRATLNNRRKGLYEDWLTPTSDTQQQQLLDVGKIK
jgi:hypothetical protein